jgi:cobalt/nickel transport system permease protein
MATGALGLGAFGYSLKRLERRLGERAVVLVGVTSAFVFAAQMVNFPVGPGVSGHLLGGVLAAVLLGPWAGAAVIGTVLIVQALLFGDGGVTALGANFLNMGVVGSVGGYAIYAPIRRGIGDRRGVVVGAMIAAWFAVILASGAFALELGASGRPAAFWPILGWMALVHVAIGVGEALITGLVVRFVLLARPDLIPDAETVGLSRPERIGQVGVAGLGIAVAVAIFLAPFASPAPDGLEWVGGRLGFLSDGMPAVVSGLIPDYSVPGIGPAWLAKAVAGLVGTLVVFGAGLSLTRALRLGGATVVTVATEPTELASSCSA